MKIEKVHILKNDEWGKPEENKGQWERIECNCGNDSFHIIYTDMYETSAKCTECGFMKIVHDG